MLWKFSLVFRSPVYIGASETRDKRKKQAHTIFFFFFIENGRLGQTKHTIVVTKITIFNTPTCKRFSPCSTSNLGIKEWKIGFFFFLSIKMNVPKMVQNVETYRRSKNVNKYTLHFGNRLWNNFHDK